MKEFIIAVPSLPKANPTKLRYRSIHVAVPNKSQEEMARVSLLSDFQALHDPLVKLVFRVW